MIGGIQNWQQGQWNGMMMVVYYNLTDMLLSVQYKVISLLKWFIYLYNK